MLIISSILSLCRTHKFPTKNRCVDFCGVLKSYSKHGFVVCLSFMKRFI